MSLETLHRLRSGTLTNNGSLLTEIRLNDCQLNAFPEELYRYVDQLTLLDLSGNQLRSLPDDFHRFHRLKILFCSNNPFTELPTVLGRCPQLEMIGFKANTLQHISPEALPIQTLRWLILTDNQLSSLPDNLGQCRRLQKLMLAGNRLSRLPDLSACQALELIRLSANQLVQMPPWLASLPALAWCAIGHNPTTHAAELAQHTTHTLAEIQWNELQIFEPLGEGASGITYRAKWSSSKSEDALAVKVFKHSMTSDGSPENELLANQAIGLHPHLTGCVGRLVSHPKNALGLVMHRLPASLKVLAAPPSLQSCSRDVYTEGFSLAPEQCQRLLLGVSKAVAHMHKQGWTHGDVYAHNILWNDTDVILSDMGAASAIPENMAWLKQIECRALGILIAELSAHTTALNQETKHALQTLSQDCRQSSLERIPELTYLISRLEQLSFV